MGLEAKLWVWGGTALVPGQPRGVIEDSAIGIADGKIVFVGRRSEVKPPASARKIDATGCLVSPGFVNGHTHIGMTLLRGFADDLPFEVWLRERIFPTESKWASPEFVYWGAMLACAEMIRSGTTSFNDMYMFESEGARAATEAGLRMRAGLDLKDKASGAMTVSDVERVMEPFLRSVSDFPLVTPTIGPHSIYVVGLESWKSIIAYAQSQKLGIHVHLSESLTEGEFTQTKFGKTPTRIFEELGLWGCQVTAAHAICLTPEDIQILGKYKVGVSHNPETNLKLGNPVAPVVELRQAGVPVALGTDGVASNNDLDLFSEADFAAKLQAAKYGAGALRSEDVFQMLTHEGARAAGFGAGVGKLEVGQAADIIAIETTGPHAVPMYNPYSHLVYSASSRDVRHTIVNGQVLMENRNLATLDEQEILREAASWARRIIA